MLFDENTPYYYINGAWQSCATPEDALQTLADTCEGCSDIVLLLKNTLDHQKHLIKEQEKEVEELEQELEARHLKAHIEVYATCINMDEAFTELLQVRKGSKAYNDIVERIYSLIDDIRTTI